MTVEPDGDPACWLDRVCDLCGGFLQGGEPHECRPSATRAAPSRLEPDRLPTAGDA